MDRPGGRESAAAGDALARVEAQGAQLRREVVERGGGEAAKGNRRGDFVQARRPPQRDGGGARAGRCGANRLRRHAQHFLDGPDAGDRLLGIREAQGDGAQQFAVNVDGAAAHALHDAGVGERAAGEAGEDDGFRGADVLEHTEHLHLEIFDPGAGKDGAADSALPGANVF